MARCRSHRPSTERLWLAAEAMRYDKVPYSGAFTPYTAGPVIQAVLAF